MHTGPTLPGAGVLGSEGGGGGDPTGWLLHSCQSSLLWGSQTVWQGMVLAALLLDVLPVSSVPAEYFRTLCPLLTTMRQYNTIASPFERSVN